jgi:HlyD family secretion protein
MRSPTTRGGSRRAVRALLAGNPPHPLRRRPRELVLLFAALAMAACSTDSTDGLTGRGTVEVVEVDVSPLATARVVAVYRHEGDIVRAGDTLVALTQTTEQAEIEGRRARLAVAEAQLRDLQLGARAAEIDRVAAELRSAEAEAVRAAADASRADSLRAGDNISAQQHEAARTAAASADARRDAVRETLRLMREGARPQLISATRGEVATARAALEAAERSAAELVLLAPGAGLVTSRNAEPGEVVPAGRSAMTIADPSRPYVRVYLGPRALPLIRIGSTAVARLDEFPDRTFIGRVVSISPRAEFTPRVALTEDERADLLFGVRIEFADDSGALRAGLPVSVTITPEPMPAAESP